MCDWVILIFGFWSRSIEDKNCASEVCFLKHSCFFFSFLFSDLLSISSFLQPLPFSFLGVIRSSDKFWGWVFGDFSRKSAGRWQSVVEGDDVCVPSPPLDLRCTTMECGPLTSWEGRRPSAFGKSLSSIGKKWTSRINFMPRGSPLSCGLLWTLWAYFAQHNPLGF